MFHFGGILTLNSIILSEWIVSISELMPLLFGLLIAYWGNRIHRAAWTGGLVMVQSVCYISLIIPHFASNTKIIEETENVTHMSLYSGTYEFSSEFFLLISYRILSRTVT